MYGLIFCPKGEDEDETEVRTGLFEISEEVVGDSSKCGGLVPFLRITVGGRT